MAIYAAIRAFVGRGDNAVIVSPAYAIFSNAVIMSGGEPRPASLAVRGNRFALDLDRVRAAIDANTRMLIVNSPSNPTGWVINEDEQRALAEMAERHDLVILADEVYERLVYDGRAIAPSFARIVANHDRLIVVNSFSKTYNMTGWRLGWAQSSESDHQDDVQGGRVHDVEPGGDGAAGGHRGASRRRAVHRGAARALCGTPRSGARPRCQSIPGVIAAGSARRLLRVSAHSAASTDSAAFTAELVRETGVALAPGVGFGRDGEGYIRVCFASTEATIADALARVKKFVNEPARVANRAVAKSVSPGRLPPPG